MLSGKKILLISTEAWGPNFVSKHHYANYLSKKNEVYFLNPAKGFNKNPFGTINIQKTKIKQNLWSVDYVNLLPKLNDLPKSIQKFTYQKQAKQIHKGLEIEGFDIIWSFDPYRYWDLKSFKSNIHLYHTVDFHPGAKFENECCQSADQVFAVTDLIETELNHKRTIKIGHGADIDGFQLQEDVKIPGSNQLKACYVGNFHNHIDYSILLNLVVNNRDCDFIMIGPTLDSNLSAGNKIDQTELNELNKQPNLHFVGSVAPGKLMSYLIQMDINLVLFKEENERLHCSPHKLMGYFYSGKVTLSNYIDEHKSTSSEIIQMAEDQNKIPELFKTIISDISEHNSVELQEKRRNFAIANSYSKKIGQIYSLIENELN